MKVMNYNPGEKSQPGKGVQNYFHLKRIILPLYTIWAMCALFGTGRVRGKGMVSSF